MSQNTYQLARLPIVSRPQGYYLRWYYNGWHYWQFFGGTLTFETVGEKYRTIGTKAVTLNSGMLTGNQAKAVRTVLNTREVYLYTDAGWQLCRIVPAAAPIVNNFLDGYELTFTAYIGSRLISNTGYSPAAAVPIVPPSEPQCERVIGSQIWACKNYDGAFPASKVYDDDEANRAIYGGLYTYDQVMSAGFTPAGWHVPTVAEWDALIAFLGGTTSDGWTFTLAGGKLKALGITYWDSPNTLASDLYSFGARAAGAWMWKYGLPMGYYNIGQLAYFWAASPAGYNYMYVLRFDTDQIYKLPGIPATDPYYTSYYSVRLVKDVPPVEPVWAAANVQTNIAGSKEYNNDHALGLVYGRLYTWNMLADIEAANVGWHVPTKQELEITIGKYGGINLAGGHMKEAGLTHWNSPNTGADNSSGMALLPAGAYSLAFSAFVRLGLEGYFWLKDEYSTTDGRMFLVYHDNATIAVTNLPKGYGLSVLLVKD